tara:strand:- start:196 stop:441 length:246 start_codon:yes stop_codon:yes gene_type:complete
MIAVEASAPVWAHELVRRIEEALGAQAGQPVRLPAFGVADLPSPARFNSCLIFISNESGGAVPAFSDGADWRRVTDRAVVS